MDGAAPARATATIILGDSDASSKQLRALIANWVTAELLDPCVWLEPGGWNQTDRDAAPVVDATLFTASGEAAIELVNYLAERPWRTVRVVAVHLLPDRDAANVDFAIWSRSVVYWAKRTKAMSTDVVAMNLIVPATGVHGVPSAILQHAWAHNLIVAPESRAGDAYSNALVRPHEIVPHAAVNLASCAALWRGMVTGAFDHPDDESNDGSPNPVVVRCATRIISAPSVMGRVSQAALQPLDDHWPVPTMLGRDAIPARDPGGIVGGAVEVITSFDNGAFSYRLPTAVPMPPRKNVGILRAIVEMLRTFLRVIRRTPDRAILAAQQALIRATENSATNFAFGEKSGLRARYGGQDREDDLEGEQRAPVDPAAAAFELLERTQQTKTRASYGATPDTWRVLRQLAFSLLDGSGVPEPFRTPTAADHREVIEQPWMLVPDAVDPYVLLDETRAVSAVGGLADQPVRSCDPATAQMLSDHFARVRSDLHAKAKSAREAAARQQDQAEAARRAFESLIAEADPQRTDDVAAARERADRERQSAESAAGLAAGIDEQLHVVTKEAGRLEQWIAVRRPSLFWRVGERASAAQAQAKRDFDVSRQRVMNGPARPDFAAVDRLRSVTRWTWAIAAIAGLLVISGSWISVGGRAAVFISVGSVVLWFVVAFLVWRRYCVALHEAVWRTEHAVAEFNQAVGTMMHSASELVRLTGVYEQYLDWAEIVAWFAHRPRADIECDIERAQTGDVDLDRLPPSLSFAEGMASDANLRALGARAGRVLAKQGWIAETYEARTTDALQRFNAQRGLSPDAILPDPADDLPLMPAGSRRYLVEELREGVMQREARDSALRTVNIVCAATPPEQVFDSVETGDRGATFNGPDAIRAFLREILPAEKVQPFDTDIWDARALVKSQQEVARTHAWIPRSVAPDHANRATVVETIDATAAGNGSYTFKAVRIDVSAPGDQSDYRLFCSRPTPPPVPGPESGDQPPGPF